MFYERKANDLQKIKIEIDGGETSRNKLLAKIFSL